MVSKQHLKRKKSKSANNVDEGTTRSRRGRNLRRCGMSSLLIGLCTFLLQRKISSSWPTLDFSLVGPSTTNSSDTASSSENNKKKKTITLVTSFFAASELPPKDHHPHRAEIEAAILANLGNEHLDQVAVILDSTSPQNGGCEQFTFRMKILLRRYFLSSTHADTNKLTCIDRPQGQPNYYEMFQFALKDPQIIGDIIILSNADMVFDDTLAWVHKMKYNTLLTLSTQGYNVSRVPANLRQIYRQRMDITWPTTPEGYAMPWCEYTPQNPWQSWDSYIFHRSWLLDESASRPKNLLTLEEFSRPSFQQGQQPFYMNEMGAELAAAATLYSHLTQNQNQSSSSGVNSDNDNGPIFWNACGIINIWHFHLKGKMHQGNGDEGRYIWPPMKEQWDQNSPSVKVPPPYKSFPKCCDPIHQCPNAFVQELQQQQPTEDRSCSIDSGKQIINNPSPPSSA